MSETEITAPEQSGLTERDIDTVTGEIIEICRQAQTMALSYAVEIGRRLCEAKELLQHGEWGNWLKERVNFSQSTANNLMRLFREYGSQQVVVCGVLSNSQALGNLPYTKALQLLAIPAEEREVFAEEHHVTEISTRELEQAIRERDEALKARDAALEAQKQAEQQRNEQVKSDQAQIGALRETKAALEKQLGEVRANAAKDAKKGFAQTEKELTDRIKALESELAETQKAAGQNQPDAEAVKRYEDEIARLRKQAAMSDPDTTEFRTVFDAVQVQIAKLTEIVNRVESTDGEKANRFRQALQALANKLIGGVE